MQTRARADPLLVSAPLISFLLSNVIYFQLCLSFWMWSGLVLSLWFSCSFPFQGTRAALALLSSAHWRHQPAHDEASHWSVWLGCCGLRKTRCKPICLLCNKIMLVGSWCFSRAGPWNNSSNYCNGVLINSNITSLVTIGWCDLTSGCITRTYASYTCVYVHVCKSETVFKKVNALTVHVLPPLEQ